MFELLKAEANTANAIAAVASAIAAILALFVSVVSLFFSARTLKHQQQHNILSVKPLAEVTVADYENSLRVKLRNNGSGPMIVQSLTATDGFNSCDALIDCMPELPGRHWTHFSHALRNRTLLPGKSRGLVTRRVLATSSPSAEYALTPLGCELLPAIQALASVGRKLIAEWEAGTAGRAPGAARAKRS